MPKTTNTHTHKHTHREREREREREDAARVGRRLAISATATAAALELERRNDGRLTWSDQPAPPYPYCATTTGKRPVIISLRYIVAQLLDTSPSENLEKAEKQRRWPAPLIIAASASTKGRCTQQHTSPSAFISDMFSDNKVSRQQSVAVSSRIAGRQV